MTSQRDKKSSLKVLAIEDGSFSKADRYCLVVGVVVTCNSIERVLLDRIHIDGTDGTKTVMSFVNRSKGVGLIMLPSVSLAGFNVIDPHELHRKLKVPVVVANPERPRLEAIHEALKRHFPDWKRRIRVFKLMGSPGIFRVPREGVLYFYAVGLSATRTRTMLRSLIRFGKKPEPLRIARIIARALSSTSPLKITWGVRR